jgi:competence protein ComEA
MKNTSLKALFCALLSSILFFTTNVHSAAPKVAIDTVVIQKYVHLNKSTIDDLITLKGIGDKKAKAIIAYRQQIGEFKSVRELMNVKGVGEKVLIDNKKRLKI